MNPTCVTHRLLSASLCVLAIIATGCAHAPRSAQPPIVDQWISEEAVPELLRWYRLQATGRTLLVSSDDVAAGEDSARWTQVIIETLAAELNNRGVPASTRTLTRPVAHKPACPDEGSPVSELFVSVHRIEDSEFAAVVLHAESSRPGSRPPFRHERQIALATSGEILDRATHGVDGLGGHEDQPYPAHQTDQMVQQLVSALRCDLLSARWRAGVPEVAFEDDQPSSWYRSVALRIRDELARLDRVIGAPASAIAVHTLELRSEATATQGVYRIVVRALVGDQESFDAGVVWQQAYYRAPGPPSESAPIDPVVPPSPAHAVSVASALEEAVPVARPRPSPAVPGIDVRLVRPGGPFSGCDPAHPWRSGFRFVDSGHAWQTGDCFAFAIGNAKDHDVYVLHYGTSQRLTRIHPTACVLASSVDDGDPLLLPDPGRARRAMQLSPPGDTETFIAVMMPTNAQHDIQRELLGLSSVCGDAGGLQARRTVDHRRLLQDIETQAAAGRMSVARLVVRHQERRP